MRPARAVAPLLFLVPLFSCTERGGAERARGGAQGDGFAGSGAPSPASASGSQGARAGMETGTESAANFTTPADTFLLTFEPAEVHEGTLFRIVLEPVGAPPDRIEARFGGEALHFEPGEDGRFRALAAAPIGQVGSLDLEVTPIQDGVRLPPVLRSVEVAVGAYRLGQLTVAPEFGDPYPADIQRRIDEESARAMAAARGTHRTPRLWSPPFLHPREDRITSGFGHGRTFNGQVQSRHMGTDFAGAVGAPVYAPARGIVALVDTFYLGGNVLYIDHGAGLMTGYLHLSAHEVAQGDTVNAGDLIGRVGATGRVTGPHLHWIVRYGEISVDGMSLLELR